MSKRWITLLLLGALAGPTATEPAKACGMMLPHKLEDTVPAIMQEQVVMIFDRENETEHFVREVRFDAGDESFGFVVPTPTQPTVGAEKSPFKALRDAYPYEKPPALGTGNGHSKGMGEGAPGGAAPAVQVLSVQRVGKFKAYVLAANDAAALDKWLADNQFQAPPDAKKWLAHYVRLHFYYVAFRYDPPKADPKKGGREMASETVRISFKTPHPYYPYLEPTGARRLPSRLLQIWMISRESMRPVAARVRLGTLEHWQPWSPGLRYEVTAGELKGKIAPLAKLLPKGDAPLVVQTYRDQKRARKSWGDVLLVPTQSVNLSDEEIEKRRPLLPVLDPSLAGEPLVQPGAVE
jgi:hypothetical protein